MRTLAALVVLAPFLAAGCAAPAPVSPYAGTVWTLDRIVAADGAVTRGSGDERLTFGADASIQLASCNQCAGRYVLDGDVLRVAEGMGCTRRACPDGQIEMERFFTAPLRLDRDGPVLTIEAPGLGGTAQLVFVAEVPAVPDTVAAP